MARLPQPGGDSGNWGDILNDYLSTSLKADGSLKDDTVGTSQLKDNSVTAAQLAPSSVTKADVGLGSVDNTSDVNKPVSTAQQAALDTKLAIANLDSETAARIGDSGSATAVALGDVYGKGALARASKAAGQRLRAKTAANRRSQVQVTVGTINATSNSSLETSLGSSTLTWANPSYVTTPAAHGLAVGEAVRFGGKTGAAYINGSHYYVSSTPSTTTFTVYANNGTSGSHADFGSNGTATVFKNLPSSEPFYSRSGSNALALTVTAATDIFTTATDHTLESGDQISFASSTAGGVVNDTRYYVKSTPSRITFTISTSVGGSTLDITSDGTATLLRVNPKLLITDGKPFQSLTTFPQYDMIKPYPVTSVGAGIATPTDLSVHTVYDGSVIEFLAFNDSANTAYIYADGVLIDTITSAHLSAAGIGSGSTGRKLYTFPDSRARLLTVRSSGVMHGWARPSNKFFYRPTPHELPNMTRFMIVGDSFTEGEYPRWVKAHLGLDNLWKCGSGSVGYKSDNARLALEDRYQTDIINQAPDVCVIALGLNDPRSTNADREATVTSATTVWDAITASLPATELIIVGPFSPKGVGTNEMDYCDGNLRILDGLLNSAANTRGLRFISPIQENWIEGDGKDTAQTGHGNSDTYIRSDGTHPTGEGHEYIGWRLAGSLSVPYLPLL